MLLPVTLGVISISDEPDGACSILYFTGECLRISGSKLLKRCSNHDIAVKQGAIVDNVFLSFYHSYTINKHRQIMRHKC